MTALKKFTPAETLLLIHGHTASYKEMMKLTLLDLICKQVLKTETANYHIPGNRQPAVNTFLVPGPQFHPCKCLLHESVFIRPVTEYPFTRLLFRHVVGMAYRLAGGKKLFRNTVLKNPAMQGLYSRNWWERITGKFSLTEKGDEIKIQLETDIQSLERELPDIVKEEPESLQTIMQQIRGNVFLLANAELFNWPVNNRELFREQKEQDHSSGAGCSGCTWIGYDSFSSSFESSGSGDSSGCSSDAGGDSGCGGGCSGCGGGD